jgi:putative hydrolase of the HAD superfamily
LTRLVGINAISFDVDGTLWDFQGVMRHSLHQALLELRMADPLVAALINVDKMIAIRDRVHEELRGKVWDLAEVRRESFRRVLRDVGRSDDELGSRLARVYFEHRDAARALFDDVSPALETLAPGYTLGVLSNGNSYPAHFGLDGLMSFTVLSQDYGGIEKPDPRIFRLVLEKSGCRPHELLHVGDSLETDVAGAIAVGARSVWLNRGGRERDADVEPDWEIRSLLELMDLK